MRALNELASCGLVVRETGRGTRVRTWGHGVVIRGATTADSGGAAWPESIGGPIESDVVSFGYSIATANVRNALDLRSGATVQASVRILRIANEPYARLTAFVREDLGRRWDQADLAHKPLQRILEEHGYSIAKVDETVTATLADMTSSEQLAVSVGAPLIKIVRTTYGKDDAPIEHMIGFYRPDRYRYKASLAGSDLQGYGPGDWRKA